MSTSNRVLVAGGVLTIVALLATWKHWKERREFSAQTTITMGKVLRSSGLTASRRMWINDMLCWVSYEFAPSPGRLERNWRFWRDRCGVSRGRLIPIQNVVSRPEVNPVTGDEPSSVAEVLPWFAAGVAVVVTIMLRRS